MHEIATMLRDARLRRHMSIYRLSKTTHMARGSIRSHEDAIHGKYTALEMLDRWAHALGFKLALVDIASPPIVSDDVRASDWHLHASAFSALTQAQRDEVFARLTPEQKDSIVRAALESTP